MLREIALALALLAGLALIVNGVAGWSMEAASVVAGVGLIAIGFLFLAEVPD